MNAGCAGKTVRTRAIPERRRGVFTTRRYTNPRLPYLVLLVGSSLSVTAHLPLYIGFGIHGRAEYILGIPMGMGIAKLVLWEWTWELE